MNRIPQLILCVVFSLSIAHSEEISLQREIFELLVSPITSEQLSGQAKLKENEQSLIAQAIEQLKSEDYGEVIQAAKFLSASLSHWKRGIYCIDNHHGLMSLGRNRRPVARPSNHEFAEQVFSTVMSVISKSNSTEVPFPHYFDQWKMQKYLVELATEVVTEDSIHEIVDLLKKTDNLEFGPHLLAMVEIYYFLPSSYQRNYLCGLTPKKRMEAFHIEELSKYKKARSVLLAYHQVSMGKSTHERMARGVSMWDEYFSQKYFYHKGPLFDRKVEALIRGGKEMLPLLREKQAAAISLSTKGSLEVIIAAITGEANEPLINRLLYSDQPTYKEDQARIGCKIIVASGSKDWMEQLNKLQYRDCFDGNIATKALAMCHRKQAIPLFEEVLKTAKKNTNAKYAIEELANWDE